MGVGGGGGREKSKNHDVVRLRKSNHPSYTSLCSNTFGRRTWRLFMFWLLINNIPRWAKWIVFEIELNLLLSCFGLSALYLPLPDPARHHSTSVHKAFPSMVIVGSLLIEDALPLPLFLSRYVIYLCTHHNLQPVKPNKKLTEKSELRTLQFYNGKMSTMLKKSESLHKNVCQN